MMGGAWVGGRYVPSLLAAIGGVIERHVSRGGAATPAAEAEVAPVRTFKGGAQCPRCGTAALIRKEGCDTCQDCGYSKCG